MTPSSDHKYKFKADAQPPKLIAVTHEPDPGEQENGNAEDFTLCVVSAGLVLEAGYLPTAPGGGSVTLILPHTFQNSGDFGGRRKAVRDRFALQGGTGDFP